MEIDAHPSYLMGCLVVEADLQDRTYLSLPGMWVLESCALRVMKHLRQGNPPKCNFSRQSSANTPHIQYRLPSTAGNADDVHRISGVASDMTGTRCVTCPGRGVSSRSSAYGPPFPSLAANKHE
jgi:hypothetical protein